MEERAGTLTLRRYAPFGAWLGPLALAACGDKTPQDRVGAAKPGVAQKGYKTATVQLKSALQALPASLQARLLLGGSLLGKALLGNGDAAGAGVELGKAPEQDAAAAEALDRKGLRKAPSTALAMKLHRLLQLL